VLAGPDWVPVTAGALALGVGASAAG
jgi:hypothetical protein